VVIKGRTVKCQPTPLYPLDPVKVRKFLTGTYVSPATTVYEGDPALPDKNILSVLISALKDSELLRYK